MANIAIVNYCNLKCPYCFAENMIQENNKYMSIEDYSNLLDFILKNPNDNIGILGGEPTLHPNFIDIINITKEKCNNRKITLFTNGIELEQFLPYLNDIDLLINYNNPDNLTKIQFDKLQNSLDKAYKMGLLTEEKEGFIGCNIYLDCSNYNYIWEIVDKYSLTAIRCSVVSPSGKYIDWRNKKDEYFKLLKPIYLNFCEEALKHKCKLIMDCSHIPSCYFNEEECKLIEEVRDKKRSKSYEVCIPVLDFTTDLKVSSCFGTYAPIDFKNFSNTLSLSMYLFNNSNKKLIKSNNADKCATCEKYKNGKCQGGCLAFACPE